MRAFNIRDEMSDKRCLPKMNLRGSEVRTPRGSRAEVALGIKARLPQTYLNLYSCVGTVTAANRRSSETSLSPFS